MLHHITWHQYFSAIIVIAIIYYLWVILRCYRPEIQKFGNRFRPKSEDLPNALQYQEAEPADTHKYQTENTAAVAPEKMETEDFPEDTETITSQLKAVIQSAAAKPYAPAALIPQLKKILQSFPDIGASPYREAITELVVQECEKTGTALLTEDEVDQWWRE